MSQLHLRQLAVNGLPAVDLSIDAGERVVLTGPSGAGKSRLLRAIADLDPHEGEACLDEACCQQVDAPQWRRWVGFLPAETAWWYPTVGEHFTAADTRFVTEAGLPEQIMSWEVQRLSSGEKQRLAILRLLALQPKALLLDEPTANLDHDNSLRMEKLIVNYQASHQAAALWVSHDPKQMRRVAHRVFHLDQHGLVERH